MVLISVAASMTLLARRDRAARRQAERRPHHRPEAPAGVAPGREGGVLGPDHAHRHGAPGAVPGGRRGAHGRARDARTSSSRTRTETGNGIKTGLAGISTLPDDVQTKQAFDALVERFPESGADSPAQTRDPRRRGPSRHAEAFERLEQAGRTGSPLGGAGGAADRPPTARWRVVELPLTGPAADPQSDAATQRSRDCASSTCPRRSRERISTVLVGGDTAFIKDFFDISNQYTPPIILALVLALSFVLLTVVFRSIVVPFKAILMNLLSVGAAYGADRRGLPEGWAGVRVDRSRTRSGSSRSTRSRPGYRCSCSRSCSGCRWTITCSC